MQELHKPVLMIIHYGSVMSLSNPLLHIQFSIIRSTTLVNVSDSIWSRFNSTKFDELAATERPNPQSIYSSQGDI